MNDNNTLLKTLQQFNLSGNAEMLPNGSQTVFRVGDVVLKPVGEVSLESNHSLALIEWIAEFSEDLREKGFRIPKGIKTVENRWLTDNNWTAWTFLEGGEATENDVPECLKAIREFHKALAKLPKHPLVDENETPWGKADRWCWGEKPDFIQPKLQSLLNRLYELRTPINGLKKQLIHGDLNPENILIAPGLAPGIIDFSPFWGPVDFAVAIFANFIGPRRGNIAILKHFEKINHFDQLLIRAGIRMLLIMSEINRLENWENCSEKKAAELIIEYVR